MQILVVGDVMLTVTGQRSQPHFAGGAGVISRLKSAKSAWRRRQRARNIARWAAVPACCGKQDEAGDTADGMLKWRRSFHLGSNHSTIIKRVIGRQQQLLRIDFRAPTDAVLRDKLTASILCRNTGGGAVRLRQRQPGQRREMIAAARQAGNASWSSQGDDFSRYVKLLC